MSAANNTLVDETSLRNLQDRTDISDALYRYSAAVDSFDTDGVRSVLADDIWAQYGNGDPVVGGDALANWIAEATATIIWQHHLLNVYHVDVDGDQASALSYLTSYQVFKENPDAAIILVARYHDELRRTPTGWKISRRVMELLWGESKADEGYLASLGGRGPKVWQRD
jgi:ketosteroid isomerase-like protein